MVGVWERGDATCRVSRYIPLLGGLYSGVARVPELV